MKTGLIVIFLACVYASTLFSNANAQSDDLSSVLKNAQESLANQNNTKSSSEPTAKLLASPVIIPKGIDIFVRTKLTYNKTELFQFGNPPATPPCISLKVTNCAHKIIAYKNFSKVI